MDIDPQPADRPFELLVVEDDPVSRKVLSVVLGRLGYKHACAENGQQAFDYFLEHKSPIIISDWMMPEMDGVTLCRRIRDLRLDDYTFFILLTANDAPESYQEAMREGVDDFLTKPLRPDALLTRLRVAQRIVLQRWEAERRIRALARFPADNVNPVLQLDRQSRLLYANAASAPLLQDWHCALGSRLSNELQALVEKAFSDGPRTETEVHSNGRIFTFATTSICENGTVYLYGHDITARKQAESELRGLKEAAEHAALHDQLSGLPNRTLLTDRLTRALVRARRQDTKLALIMVDIDNFKEINDGYGHRVGDQVIVLIAQTLRDNLRQTDTVCRWGGDELVILLPDLKDRSAVPAVCAKLSESVRQVARDADLPVPVTLSQGFSLFPDDADGGSLLLQQADYALYTAKADGRNCWREFKGFARGANAKTDLFNRLSEAIAAGKIQVFFQPLVDAGTQAVVGAEALARWQDEQFGWVSPDIFIPLAEAKGLISRVGQLVIERTLTELVAWRRRGFDLSVSVNLSRRQALDAEFCPWLVERVAQAHAQPGWLCLELTERQPLQDHALGRQRLLEFAAAGFHLSVDDFGSGYSSFELIGELPFHELKLCMSLVRKATTSTGRRIVQAIVDLSRTLGLTTVAEGVETKALLQILREVGVNKVQGYLFSPPVAAPAFGEYLEATKTAGCTAASGTSFTQIDAEAA